MNNRIPMVILGALVLIALIYRIVNPPEPPTPGPKGKIPTWISMSKVGDMGSWKVSPSGTMWAGAWNTEDKNGKARSAIWIIDFEKPEATPHKIDGKVEYITWADNTKVRAFTVGENNQLVRIDTSGRTEDTPVETSIVHVPIWPDGSANLVSASNNAVSAQSEAGEAIGQEVALPLTKDIDYGPMGAISADGKLLVVSTQEDSVGRKLSFYLGHTTDGSSKLIFGSEGLPGKVEGVWVSDAGVLVLCSERDKFDRLVYDINSDTLTTVKPSEKIDLNNWPEAPKDMMFVSYNAGYKLSLTNGKTHKLFGFDKLRRSDERWRREVQGGRLYSRKDGNYTSVSLAAGAIDIRTIKKDGTRGTPILPRQ